MSDLITISIVVAPFVLLIVVHQVLLSLFGGRKGKGK